MIVFLGAGKTLLQFDEIFPTTLEKRIIEGERGIFLIVLQNLGDFVWICISPFLEFLALRLERTDGLVPELGVECATEDDLIGVMSASAEDKGLFILHLQPLHGSWIMKCRKNILYYISIR